MEPQFSIFKDCLARQILARAEPSDPSRSIDPDLSSDNQQDLDDFTSYLAAEAWPSFPDALRNLTYDSSTSNTIVVENISLDCLPTSFVDTFISYSIAPDSDSVQYVLRKVLEEYVKDASAAPPVWSSTRATECEICERAIPLSYHHLIPRSVHAKVLKRKWHPEWMLNSVAWLCRQCHSTVHHVATNEELAREFHTVELLLAREDIQKWKKYAAKQRYGKRRG